MKRKLKIAFSVLSVVACVLLCVLWVRSYWWIDGLYVIRDNNGGVSTVLARGHVNCTVDLGSPFWQGDWSVQSRLDRGKLSPAIAAHGFDWAYGKYGTKTSLYVKVPYWFLVLLAVIPVAPWIRRVKRFSLRMLLIATTLVCVVLGMIAWAAR